jgi:hypothetical protein
MFACEASDSIAKITDTFVTSNDDSSGNFTLFSGDYTFCCDVKVANDLKIPLLRLSGKL